MGGHSTTHPASGTLRRRSWSRRLFATLPFVVACSLAGATMNAALTPARGRGEELRLEQNPPAQTPEQTPGQTPGQTAPAHHDDTVFDPSELISV